MKLYTPQCQQGGIGVVDITYLEGYINVFSNGELAVQRGLVLRSDDDGDRVGVARTI